MEALSEAAVAAGARASKPAHAVERLVTDGPPGAPRVVGLQARIEGETRHRARELAA